MRSLLRIKQPPTQKSDASSLYIGSGLQPEGKNIFRDPMNPTMFIGLFEVLKRVSHLWIRFQVRVLGALKLRVKGFGSEWASRVPGTRHHKAQPGALNDPMP